MHLGLRVPAGGCAVFEIAGQQRAWEAGRVLVFDDSFEHQVWNNCTERRAVLQLVLVHPLVLLRGVEV